MWQKAIFGVKNDLGLNINAIKVLQRRYLQQNKKGKTIETAETDTNNEQLVAYSEFGGGCEGIVCPH